MSVMYFKVLSEYYHHIIQDLTENKRNFLNELHSFIIADDEYGYPPDLTGLMSRIEYLLKQISINNKGMSIEEYVNLQKWYREDAWSPGEIDEYFLYHKDNKEIKIIYDLLNLTDIEKEILKNLDNFIQNKGKVLKFFNPHNGKYQKLTEILSL